MYVRPYCGDAGSAQAGAFSAEAPAAGDSGGGAMQALHGEAAAGDDRVTGLLEELQRLPVRAVVDDALAALEQQTSVILEAPPGAGKTTTLPLAIVLSRPSWLAQANSKVLVLEPRRLAARAAAARMAALLGEQVGQTVGYRVRMESRVGPETAVEVVTDGILLRIIQSDPGLSGYGAVLLDEFHERSADVDQALALVRDTQSLLRDDLRIVVMSATLGPTLSRSLTALLASEAAGAAPAPLIRSEGKSFPLEVHYLGAPGEAFGALEDAVAEAAQQALAQHPGNVLCFLPGVGEIRRTMRILEAEVPRTVEVVMLHGGQTLQQQQQALQRPVPGAPAARRIVLATPVAESSLTVPGVRVVVDSGLARVPAFSPDHGLSRLVVQPISQASATQRAGRAAREGPGAAYRLWSERAHLQRPDSALPEILSADLTSLALHLAMWQGPGGDYQELPWVDQPPADMMAYGQRVLRWLGALEGGGRAQAGWWRDPAATLEEEEEEEDPSGHGPPEEISASTSNSSEASHSGGGGGSEGAMAGLRVTERGRQMSKLPLHPRLAHMVLCGWELGWGEEACQLAAMLEDRDLFRGNRREAGADMRLRLDVLRGHGKGTELVAKGAVQVDEGALRAVRREAERLQGLMRRIMGERGAARGPAAPLEAAWRREVQAADAVVAVLLATAFPDRVCQRSDRGGPAGASFQLSSGRRVRFGSRPGEADPLAAQQYVAVAEVLGGQAERRGRGAGMVRRRGGAGSGAAMNDLVTLAAPLPAHLLELCLDSDAPAAPGAALLGGGLEVEERVFWAAGKKEVRARRVTTFGALTVAEAPLGDPDAQAVTDCLLAALARPRALQSLLRWTAKVSEWQARVAWARDQGASELPDVSDGALEGTVAQWLGPHLQLPSGRPLRTSKQLQQLDILGILRGLFTWDQQQQVNQLAPAALDIPSGRSAAVAYMDHTGGQATPVSHPFIAVGLQEMLGAQQSPMLGRCPVQLQLLNPAGRPLALTQDLASFWKDVYPEVRKEMLGRYPKHTWPEDPANAKPAVRGQTTKKRYSEVHGSDSLCDAPSARGKGKSRKSRAAKKGRK